MADRFPLYLTVELADGVGFSPISRELKCFWSWDIPLLLVLMSLVSGGMVLKGGSAMLETLQEDRQATDMMICIWN